MNNLMYRNNNPSHTWTTPSQHWPRTAQNQDSISSWADSYRNTGHYQQTQKTTDERGGFLIPFLAGAAISAPFWLSVGNRPGFGPPPGPIGPIYGPPPPIITYPPPYPPPYPQPYPQPYPVPYPYPYPTSASNPRPPSTLR